MHSSTAVAVRATSELDRKTTVVLDPARFESRLIARIQSGDEEACEVLVRQFGPRMLSVTRRILGCEDDARDALQDAFLQAFRAVERFRGDSRLSTWLHRIAVNAALLKLRTKKRRREVELDALLPKFDSNDQRVEVEDTSAVEPAEALESGETRRIVREHIALLPDSYRQVILLRDIEGLDTEETARVLGITGNAAKIRLHRARQALAELLRTAGLA